MSKKITAIILNYRHQKDSAKCLAALKRTDLGYDLNLILVDNSPSEANSRYFTQKFPGITYIASPKNLGFAGGNNQGIKIALENKSDYILIINPDVIVPEKIFVPLLKNFSDKKVGIVAPAIIHKQKDALFYGLEGKVNWKLAKPEHRNLQTLDSIKPVISEFVTFACVLISAENFKKVGLLDDKYFMYFEDVDYCLSTNQRGQKIILDPSVCVSHNTSSSFSKPTDKLKISFRSHLRFISKRLHGCQKLIPFLYAIFLYPYLYVLWTYHFYKYNR